jgi:hypothetical protein
MITLVIFLLTALNCFAYSPGAQQSPAPDVSHIESSPGRTNPEPLSELRHRGSPLVNLNSIPLNQCGLWEDLSKFFGACNSPSSDTIPTCPRVSVPCPAHPADLIGDIAEGIDDLFRGGCYTYTVECFCKAPIPLTCAWGCNWTGWMYVEDWFRNLCPHTPQVDFSPLPACARDCISDGSFNYGCITQTSSCFCLRAELFDCPAQCSTAAELDQIKHWYAKQCGHSLEYASTVVSLAAGDSLNNNTRGIQSVAVIRSSGKSELTWYEYLAIATICLTVVVAVICFSYFNYGKAKEMELYPRSYQRSYQRI